MKGNNEEISSYSFGAWFEDAESSYGTPAPPFISPHDHLSPQNQTVTDSILPTASSPPRPKPEHRHKRDHKRNGRKRQHQEPNHCAHHKFH